MNNPNASKTIEGVATTVAREFENLVKSGSLVPLVPRDAKVSVTLQRADGRKIRKNADSSNWSVESDTMLVSFQLSSDETATSPPFDGEHTAPDTGAQRITDLIRALDRAEVRPGYNFVALKWFRDVGMQTEGSEWTKDDAMRDSVLREAIERKLVLTGRVQNPRNPQFPVTSIRLNRGSAEVLTALGRRARSSGFQPVNIRGEALSTTVLSERR